MKQNPTPVNDIAWCLRTARHLAGSISQSSPVEKDLFGAFQSLAGDNQIGFLAYVIWRSRANQFCRLS